MVAKRKYIHTFRVPKDPAQPLKFWRAIIELKAEPGKRNRRYINSKDRDKAERLAAEFKKDAAAANGELSTRSITVADWFAEWFPVHCLEIKPKTINTYDGLIRREILPALGKIKIDRLSTADVRAMLAGITAKGLSSTTAAQVHRILVIALNAAEADGRVARNPAKKVKAPRKAATQLVALTAAEGGKVLEAANSDPWRSLWYAVLHTGARQGELLGLEIDRVGEMLDLSWQLQRLTWEHGCNPFCGRKRGSDCRQRKITAPADWQARHLTGGFWLTAPKTAGSKRILLPTPTLRAELQRHLDATVNDPNPFGLVWRMPDGNPIDPRVQSEAWHALLARAEVPQVRLHDGRHTAVDMLYEQNVPEDMIQMIVGHSVRSTTRGYKSNVDLTRYRVAMTKMDNAYVKPESGTPEVVVLSPAALER